MLLLIVTVDGAQPPPHADFTLQIGDQTFDPTALPSGGHGFFVDRTLHSYNSDRPHAHRVVAFDLPRIEATSATLICNIDDATLRHDLAADQVARLATAPSFVVEEVAKDGCELRVKVTNTGDAAGIFYGAFNTQSPWSGSIVRIEVPAGATTAWSDCLKYSTEADSSEFVWATGSRQFE